jgi:hypothetical protein
MECILVSLPDLVGCIKKEIWKTSEALLNANILQVDPPIQPIANRKENPHICPFIAVEDKTFEL